MDARHYDLSNALTHKSCLVTVTHLSLIGAWASGKLITKK